MDADFCLTLYVGWGFDPSAPVFAQPKRESWRDWLLRKTYDAATHFAQEAAKVVTKEALLAAWQRFLQEGR